VEWALKAAKSEAKAMATEDSQMETTITEAVRSRSSYFRKQSDSLTFEGVRRFLENDLGLKTFTLDAHKQLIKKLLQENFDSSEDDDASGNLTENETEAEDSKLEKSSRSSEPLKQKMQTEDNGGLKEQEVELPKKQAEEETDIETPDQDETSQAGPEKVDTEVKDKKEATVEVNEAVIREAFSKRASYLRAEIESISMGGVRRLLEQDLQLEKKALDAHKTLIGKLVDEVLTSPIDAPNDVKETKKKSQKKKSSKGKENDSEQEVEKKKFDSTEDSIESTGISRDDEEIEETRETLKGNKSKKRRGEDVTSKTLKAKKRKKEPESEEKKSVKKVSKKQKAVKDEDTEQLKPESMRKKEVESDSEDESPVKHQTSEVTDSDSSVDKVIKKEGKKATNASVVHGERVEHLKKIIKACGMTVPPIVYRKARQYPESKQEAQLIEELMAILKREGLSSSPTDKEIRAVKRRKEKAKELEGIDTTNIISEPRGRRAASNFFLPPPQYKVSDEDEEDSDDEDDSKSSEDDEPVIEEEESD